MNEWISVEDRLPESGHEGSMCLVCERWSGNVGKVLGGGLFVGVASFLHHKNLWVRAYGEAEVYEYSPELKITHWMPLPEPPK